jgi:hypothetical protein
MALDEILDDTGHPWKLGWKPPPPQQAKLRSARTSLQDYRVAAGMPPLIPRSEWVPIDLVTGYPLALIEDQRNYGSCTAATATGAGNRMRHFRGQPYVSLSWCWLYDQVNGGRDQGSNIDYCNEVVRREGVPPMSAYPDCTFNSNYDPQGVPYYREDVEVRVDSFDEICTAIQMLMFPQFPVDAANCQQFDGDGIGIGNGRNPNHSVYGAGLEFVRGIWVVRGVNSWRTSFGPFDDGTWRMTESQIDGCDVYQDGIAHASTLSPVDSGVPDPVLV